MPPPTQICRTTHCQQLTDSGYQRDCYCIWFMLQSSSPCTHTGIRSARTWNFPTHFPSLSWLTLSLTDFPKGRPLNKPQAPKSLSQGLLPKNPKWDADPKLKLRVSSRMWVSFNRNWHLKLMIRVLGGSMRIWASEKYKNTKMRKRYRI